MTVQINGKLTQFKYKRDFLIKHKGHHQTYQIIKQFVLFCTVCNEYHVLNEVKDID